jgi:hypothetical protein
MTNKQTFINAIEAIKGTLNAEALDYFETVIKSRKVNKKEVEKSQAVKDAILAFLKANKGYFDRTEIAKALNDSAELPEGYLLNEKGALAVNSITAFANQLAVDGKIKKEEVKVGKATKVKYSA